MSWWSSRPPRALGLFSVRLRAQALSTSAILNGTANDIVNYPSVRPADHIPFTVYSNNATSGLPLAQQSTIISGETPDVLFASHNRSQGGVGTEGSDCQ